MKETQRFMVAMLVGLFVSAAVTVMDFGNSSSPEISEYGLGCILEEINATSNVSFNNLAPPSWDWRDYGIMTSVKNQGACGSCVAFACVGAFEAVIKWKTGATVDLSEAHLFFCGGGDCANGWWVSSALDYLKNYGTPDENCFPYDGAAYGNDLPCSNTCDDWQQRAYKIDNWGTVTGATNIKNALVNYGPLVVTYTVYEDFDDYWANPSAWPNQVYYHYYGAVRGGHAVVLVGYDDAGQYWICKNSWGTSGGLNGYFKIRYGEVGIDDGAYYLVYNPSLIANAHGPYKARPGETVQFYGTAYGGTEPYTWHWDFGDGSTSTQQNPTHVYTKAGTYTVTLTVTDANGLQAIDTTKAIINTPPSSPHIKGPNSGKVNKPQIFYINATDADGDEIKYYIDWGDGSKSSTDYYPSGEDVIVQHVWGSVGEYTIRVQAEDERGSTSTITYHSIRIGAGEPPYKPSDPYPPNNATGVPLNVKLSWKGGDPDGETVYYTVYLGEDEFNMTKIADNITATNVSTSLKPFTRYYWKVVARDPTGLYSESDTWTFLSKDVEAPSLTIIQPVANQMYIGNFSIPFIKTFVVGKIYVIVDANDTQSGIDRVEFYVDGELMATDNEAPYQWLWNEDTLFDTHLLEVVAYDRDGNVATASMEVTVFNLFP